MVLRKDSINSVLEIAKALKEIKDTNLVAEALLNLGLKTAASRDVGTGVNQIPDMSSFTASANSTGWLKLPSGVVIQWGQVGTDPGALVTIPFPIPFPNNLFQIVGSCLDVNNANIVAINSTDKINLNIVAWVVSQNVVTVTRTQTPVKWIAIGN